MVKRIVLSSLVSVLLAAGLAPAAGAVSETHGYFAVSGYQSLSYGSQLFRDGEVSAVVDEFGVLQVGASHGDVSSYFHLKFAPAPGAALTAGDYEEAQLVGYQDPGHPGIDFGGPNYGCFTGTTGKFTIHDIAPDLSRLWITWDHDCKGAVSFGEVKIGEPEDPELLVMPQTIDWPTLFDKSTSEVPVTLQNTGTGSVTISSAAVSSGADAFAVTSNPCAVIAAGATCLLKVAFAPRTVGTFTGTLTIHDSTSTGTRAIPLRGASRSAPVTAAITTDRSPFGYGSTAPITVTMGGTWTNPSLSISRKVVGQSTELIATTGVGPDGSVTVPVVVRQNTTFTVSWTDGDQSGIASKAITVTPFKVVLYTPHTTVKYPTKAHLDISLRGISPIHKVKVYKKVGTHARALYSTRYVSTSTGKVSLDIPVAEKTTISVDWTDGITAASSSKTFSVVPKILATPRGYYGRSGSTYLYRPGSRIYIVSKVYPSRPGACTNYYMEIEQGGVWRSYASAGCVRLSSDGTSAGYLNYRSTLPGRRLRVASGFTGDARNLEAHTPWIYVTYR